MVADGVIPKSRKVDAAASGFMRRIMARRKDPEFEASSGNIFADLGMPRRNMFDELMTGVKEMAAHRETSTRALSGTKPANKNAKKTAKKSSKSGRR